MDCVDCSIVGSAESDVLVVEAYILMIRVMNHWVMGGCGQMRNMGYVRDVGGV